jgi:hypothetical protein
MEKNFEVVNFEAVKTYQGETCALIDKSMAYNVQYTYRKLAQSLRSQSQFLAGAKMESVVNACYHVLNALAPTRLVVRRDNKGTNLPTTFEKLAYIDPKDALAIVRKKSKSTWKKYAHKYTPPKLAGETMLPEIKEQHPRGLTAAIEYLDIAEDAVKEAMEIVREIQQTLT